MKVCIYLETANLLRKSGIYRAYANHVEALKRVRVDFTTDPRDRYDILHIHWPGPRSFRYLKRAKKKGIPVVVHAHSIGKYDLVGSFTAADLIAPVYEWLLNRFYARADAIFVPSDFAAGMLRKRGLGAVYVVSNGVDLSRFRPDPKRREEWRRRLALKGFAIYCSGNVIPRKGVMDFIAVAERLPRYEFVWFGQRWGPLAFHPRMEWKIRRAPRNVRFAGFVDDSAGAYDACDLFFFPTHGETQSLVVLEAAALGKPMVLRDIPSFSYLKSGVHCLKGSTPEEFADLIRKLATDGMLREKLMMNAYKFAEEHDLPAVGRKLLALYGKVIAGGER
ncbi:TPA: glycosyltransferase, partial [Candidatus Micrarchaeota archaeon]|nr:glycosyltransferase [Candidatus Micrarchaeota archaeon]